jgi:DnaJ family protein A protein 2
LFGGSHRSAPQAMQDTVFRMKLTLEEMFKGIEKSVEINRTILCKRCDGKGVDSGRAPECRSCDGKGHKIVMHQLAPGFVQRTTMPCKECNGTGEIIPDSARCRVCKGKKVMEEKKKFELRIPPGAYEGQKFTFERQGDEAPGKISGDVIIVLLQIQHEKYKRNKLNLSASMDVPLITALVGGTIYLDYLDGTHLAITLHTGEIRPGEIKKVSGKGMKHPEKSYLVGDLLIKFNVIFPESHELTPAVINDLTKILGTPPLTKLKDPSKVCNVLLSNADRRSFTAQDRRDEMEEDEYPEEGDEREYEHPGPHETKAQCVSQ